MPYTALPDMRMPYDDDGTVLGYGVASNAGSAQAIANGVSIYPSGGDRLILNGFTYGALGTAISVASGYSRCVWLFFPESREVTAFYYGGDSATTRWGLSSNGLVAIYGSTDTTNGVDGTWETGSYTAAAGSTGPGVDKWRANLTPVSFTGPKKAIRFIASSTGGYGADSHNLVLFHLYGEKAAGQTPDDIIYIDHDTTPGVEYTAPEDFGDRPLATTVTRQFRVKNTSATLTANTINIQCNDADFVISTDNTTWVVTINIGSLGPGAESSTMYVRNTTPAVGTALGPRFARIVTTVGSWT
ncbi:MAG TPA: hypothetical protein VIK38_06195 [Coriobacteriia bacterium]